MQLPNFLKLPVYAFDVSDQSYKYLLLKEKKEGVVVDDFGAADIPNGVIERGEIKKPDVLIAQFRALFQLRGIKYVALALPEEKGFLRTIKLSGIKEEEVGRALEFQLKKHRDTIQRFFSETRKEPRPNGLFLFCLPYN